MGRHPPNPNGEIRIAAAFSAAFSDVRASAFGIGAPYPRPFPEAAQVAARAKESID